MRRSLIVTLILSLHLMVSSAQGHFTWTSLAQEAYQKTLQLRFAEANTLLIQLEQQEPDNLIALHIANYQDFLRVYINEDETEFNRLEPSKDRRLRRIKQSGDPDSPWYLYLQADIRLQWALARLKFEEYGTAFLEVNKAFALLSQNAERFPDFLPNQKDLGILHAMVGTIPDGYKWAVEWLSHMEGSIQQGQAELEEVIAAIQAGEPFIFEEEAYALYAYLMLHLNNDDASAWSIIQDSRLNPRTNLLACFVMANVAMRTGHNDQAIELLLNRPRGSAYHPFPYLNFMLGTAKLQRLDPDADAYLRLFLLTFEGRNFRKEARQKMAWHYLLQGDTIAYRQQMRQVQREGLTIVGGDAAAQREAEVGLIPHPALLRARVLFDGGYFDRADAILTRTPASSLYNDRDQLEYTYRRGRIAHAQGNFLSAINFYQRTIEKGRRASWYFACRAALEIGHIYEEQGEKQKARQWYETCLSIKPDEHRTGLHQAAKAGLERL
jgi:tetratricopeptide (TPR) repeat protein